MWKVEKLPFRQRHLSTGSPWPMGWGHSLTSETNNSCPSRNEFTLQDHPDDQLEASLRPPLCALFVNWLQLALESLTDWLINSSEFVDKALEKRKCTEKKASLSYALIALVLIVIGASFLLLTHPTQIQDSRPSSCGTLLCVFRRCLEHHALKYPCRTWLTSLLLNI